MYAKSAAAVALLAAAPVVSAAGATVQNSCSFPVYLWSVSDYSGPMQTIQPGSSFSQPYLTNPNGGGVSLKIATDPTTAGEVTQFEYTLESTLWYDMSNINGNPFMQWGMSLVPSDSSCRNVLCPAGVEECSAAYNTPDQNYATAMCGADADTTLVLCSGQDNSGNVVAQAAQAVGNVLNVKQKHHHGKHHHHHHHKAAAPAPTAAPVVPAPVAGVMTTFLTEIVTVTAA